MSQEPLTATDLQLGHAPIDLTTMEFTDNRRAVYGPPPWGVSRINVIRQFALVLMALEGGHGVSTEDLTIGMGKRGRSAENHVTRRLLRRHGELSIVPFASRVLYRFAQDAQAWERDLTRPPRDPGQSLIDHISIEHYEGLRVPGLYNFILQFSERV